MWFKNLNKVFREFIRGGVNGRENRALFWFSIDNRFVYLR